MKIDKIIVAWIAAMTITTISFLRFFEKKNLKINISLWEEKKSSK
jgi:hypothetical protein